MGHGSTLDLLGDNPVLPCAAFPTHDAATTAPIGPHAVDHGPACHVSRKDLQRRVRRKYICMAPVCSRLYLKSAELEALTEGRPYAPRQFARFASGPKDPEE